MAKFKLKDPELWLPAWARGRGVKVLAVRTKGGKQSGKKEHKIPPGAGNGAGFMVEVTDARAIRHLKADPRFDQVGG